MSGATDAVYAEYEEMTVADCLKDGLDPDDAPLVRAFAQALWTFAWSQGEDELGAVEVFVRDGLPYLRLVTWVLDSDSGRDRPRLLNAEIAISRFTLPEEQIRHLVHAHLCRQADKQLWFDGKRPFHPHRTD